jgi:tRNA(adenine34) deaminase
MTVSDEKYMRRALELASEAELAGDVPVGAVLVSDGLVVEARNEKESSADATAHAEMLALRRASHALGTWRLGDATLYVTKEPCIVCAGAMIAARMRRLVYAANDPKGGADGGAFDLIRSRATNHRIEVEAGVLQSDASVQLQRFFRARRAAEGIEPATP